MQIDYMDFAEKILEDTKNNELQWRYLDSNEELYEGMNWTKKDWGISMTSGYESVSPNFDKERSFCARIGDTHIVLLTRKSTLTEMYVVPPTYKKVVKFDAETYGEIITRLLNIIHSKFPDAKDFIQKYLDGEKPQY